MYVPAGYFVFQCYAQVPDAKEFDQCEDDVLSPPRPARRLKAKCASPGFKVNVNPLDEPNITIWFPVLLPDMQASLPEKQQTVRDGGACLCLLLLFFHEPR